VHANPTPNREQVQNHPNALAAIMGEWSTNLGEGLSATLTLGLLQGCPSLVRNRLQRQMILKSGQFPPIDLGKTPYVTLQRQPYGQNPAIASFH
jgi:hypothetical protein